MKHDFNFDDAMSVDEFFMSNGVTNKSFLLRTCTAESGDKFNAVGFANGETTEDGRPSYTFFVLSRKLEEQGEILDKAFLKAHKDDLQLLEPVDGLKFGICFLAGNADNWDEL